MVTVLVQFRHPLVNHFADNADAVTSFNFIFEGNAGWEVHQVTELFENPGSPTYSVTLHFTGEMNSDQYVRLSPFAQEFDLEWADVSAGDPVVTVFFGAPVAGAGMLSCNTTPDFYGRYTDENVTISLNVIPASPFLTKDYISSHTSADPPESCWVVNDLVSMDGGVGASWEIRTAFIPLHNAASNPNCFKPFTYMTIFYHGYEALPGEARPDMSFTIGEAYCFTEHHGTITPNIAYVNVTKQPLSHSGSGVAALVSVRFEHPLLEDRGSDSWPLLFEPLFDAPDSGGLKMWTISDISKSETSNTFHFVLDLAETDRSVTLRFAPALVDVSTTPEGIGYLALFTVPFIEDTVDSTTIDSIGQATFNCSAVPIFFGPYNNISQVYDLPITVQPPSPSLSLDHISSTSYCVTVRELINVDGMYGEKWIAKINLQNVISQPGFCTAAVPMQQIFFTRSLDTTVMELDTPKCTAYYSLAAAPNTMMITPLDSSNSYGPKGKTIRLRLTFLFPLLEKTRRSDESSDSGVAPSLKFQSLISVNSSGTLSPTFDGTSAPENAWDVSIVVLPEARGTIAIEAFPSQVEDARLQNSDKLSSIVYIVHFLAFDNDSANSDTGGDTSTADNAETEVATDNSNEGAGNENDLATDHSNSSGSQNTNSSTEGDISSIETTSADENSGNNGGVISTETGNSSRTDESTLGIGDGDVVSEGETGQQTNSSTQGNGFTGGGASSSTRTSLRTESGSGMSPGSIVAIVAATTLILGATIYAKRVRDARAEEGQKAGGERGRANEMSMSQSATAPAPEKQPGKAVSVTVDPESRTNNPSLCPASPSNIIPTVSLTMEAVGAAEQQAVQEDAAVDAAVDAATDCIQSVQEPVGAAEQQAVQEDAAVDAAVDADASDTTEQQTAAN
jgi:hypothetical protein